MASQTTRAEDKKEEKKSVLSGPITKIGMGSWEQSWEKNEPAISGVAVNSPSWLHVKDERQEKSLVTMGPGLSAYYLNLFSPSLWCSQIEASWYLDHSGTFLFPSSILCFLCLHPSQWHTLFSLNWVSFLALGTFLVKPSLISLTFSWSFYVSQYSI